MNRNLESVLRFVNLTASGLLAGSLGFGEAALVPGWKEELPRDQARRAFDALRELDYFNAIGPLALGTAVTLAVASRGVNPMRRILDAGAAVALAGVVGATVMLTVPINKELEAQAAADYPSDRSQSLTRNWSRAHAIRTSLGVSAFVCAVASTVTGRR
jgi:uncharacterized membrane protein